MKSYTWKVTFSKAEWQEWKRSWLVWTEFSEQFLGNSSVGLHVLHSERKHISAAQSEAPAIWISGLLFTMVIRYLHKSHHQFSGPWRILLIRKAQSQSGTAEVRAPMQTATDSLRFNWWVYTGSVDFCPYHLTCFPSLSLFLNRSSCSKYGYSFSLKLDFPYYAHSQKRR